MRALETLPQTVDDLYQQSLRRIDLLPKATRDVAYRTLSWVMLSWRPLKMIELRWAVALTGSENASLDSLCNEAVLISSCTGLIRVNHTNEVTFVRQ
jgi:ankyrin repeat domain-containing protein 50